MQKKRLGRDGPEISVIGFGAWEAGKGSEWGQAPPDEQILAAITSVFDTGIDWIDTAEVYGRGTSEGFVASSRRAPTRSRIRSRRGSRGRTRTSRGFRSTHGDDALRVSLADKLHNSRAILRDLKAAGDWSWHRRHRVELIPRCPPKTT